jgi:hypothetical protein
LEPLERNERICGEELDIDAHPNEKFGLRSRLDEIRKCLFTRDCGALVQRDAGSGSTVFSGTAHRISARSD